MKRKVWTPPNFQETSNEVAAVVPHIGFRVCRELQVYRTVQNSTGLGLNLGLFLFSLKKHTVISTA
jgi:hypothetical protein